jgi:hypothetical protein
MFRGHLLLVFLASIAHLLLAGKLRNSKYSAAQARYHGASDKIDKAITYRAEDTVKLTKLQFTSTSLILVAIFIYDR